MKNYEANDLLIEGITATDVINNLVDHVLDNYSGISKSEAKKIVLSSLTYNVVIADVMNHVDWMMEEQ